MADLLALKDAGGTSRNIQIVDNTGGTAGAWTHATMICAADGQTKLGVFAEDAAHSSGDVGILPLAKRTDTAAVSSGTDGDYSTINVDASGRLWVHCSALEPGVAATSLGKAEDAAHSSGDTGVFALAVRADSAASTAGSDGDYTALITDSTGRQWVHCSALEPGTAATSLGKAEDAAHTSGDVGVAMLAKRTDTAAVSGGTDGDYSTVNVDANGLLWVNPGGSGAACLGKAEDAAHSSGDVGVMSLSVRKDTAAATSGTDGDYQPLITDANGRLHTIVGVITAGETHIGEIAQPLTVISVTPTIDTNIFATGDAVGGKQTLTSACRVSGGVAQLDSLTIIDKGNQKQAMDILFFDADPSAATITNNAAFVFSTDIAKLIGTIHIDTTDWVTVNSNAVVSKKALALLLKANGSANVYAAVVGTGTPTYGSTTDLIFKYGFGKQN